MAEENGSNMTQEVKQKPAFTKASIVLIIALIVMVFSMFVPGARLTDDYQLYVQLFGSLDIGSGLTAAQVAEPSAFTIMQLDMQQEDKTNFIVCLIPAALTLACFACVLAKKSGPACILAIFAGLGTFALSTLPVSVLKLGMHEMGPAVYVAAAASIAAQVSTWIWRYQVLKVQRVSPEMPK